MVTVESIRTTILSAAAGLLLLAAAVPAAAIPLDLVLEGRVTESVSGDPAPGEPFSLELWLEGDLSTLIFYPHLITNDAIQVRLVLPGDDYRYDDGVWFSVAAHYIDVYTGDIVPPDDVDLENPDLNVRVILGFEAFEERGGGRAPDAVWARLELWYPVTGVLTRPLGDTDDFLGALHGGEVELRSAGETVLTGVLVPEPNTALLMGLGLTGLAASRTRGRRYIRPRSVVASTTMPVPIASSSTSFATRA